MPGLGPLSGDDPSDDALITDDAVVFRRIPPGRWRHQEDGRPHTDNFTNSPDGTGTSVEIVEAGYSLEKAIAELPEGFGAVLIPVSAIRAAGLGIVRDKLPDNAFHATIQGKKKESRRKKIATAAGQRWVRKPDTRTLEEILASRQSRG